MKIWCDVCSKNKASIFCSADEAALCDDCDPRVHHANKLASKHQRLSLLQPSSSYAPLCDICQEKKALLFCQQDRAILCIDCDVPIHTANELTQKHDRFLLTGVRLSALSTTAAAKTTSKSTVPDPKPQNLTTKMLNFKAQPTAATVNIADGGGSTSSISEYLTEMLPGWVVRMIYYFWIQILSVELTAMIVWGYGFHKHHLSYSLQYTIQAFMDPMDWKEMIWAGKCLERGWMMASLCQRSVINLKTRNLEAFVRGFGTGIDSTHVI